MNNVTFHFQKQNGTPSVKEIMALPANKFVCGNDLCDKYVEYCDDPSGNGDIDFMTCKPCSYSIDQCIAGDYHPGCTKYCYDQYDQAKISSTCSYEWFIYSMVAIAALLAMYVITTCLLSKLNPRGRKILSCLKKPFAKLACRKKGERSEMMIMLNDGKGDAEKCDHEGEEETGEQPTLAKTISDETLGETADSVDQTADNDRVGSPARNIHGVNGRVENGACVQEEVAAAEPQLQSQPQSRASEVRRPLEESIVRLNYTRLNDIPNAGTDTPEPAFR